MAPVEEPHPIRRLWRWLAQRARRRRRLTPHGGVAPRRRGQGGAGANRWQGSASLRRLLLVTLIVAQTISAT